MITAKQVEEILRSNNISPTAPDEVIKSVLMGAKFDKNEIDTAIMVLRQNTNNNTSRVDGLHKVFRTNQSLNAAEISQLLGIEVDLPEANLEPRNKSRKFSFLEMTLIVVLSAILAVFVTMFFMHMYGIGPFYTG